MTSPQLKPIPAVMEHDDHRQQEHSPRPAALDPSNLPRQGARVFQVFGGFVTLMGVFTVFEDPAGFAAIAFGLFFIGAGALVKRLFVAPPGKKDVVISSQQAGITTSQGLAGTRRHGVIIRVDANATEEQVEQARRSWVDEQWRERQDWVEGRIVEESSRRGGLLKLAAGMWTVFTLGLSAAAALSGEQIIWFVGALPSGVITTAIFGALVYTRLHTRKFAPSHFVPTALPAFLGATLAGEVQTGVRQQQGAAEGFNVALKCIHRWEERLPSSSNKPGATRRRRDVLWETQAHARGRVGSGTPHAFVVPVDFSLPKDGSPTTLGSSSEGILWELSIHASLPGLDYRADFEVPVFASQDLT